MKKKNPFKELETNEIPPQQLKNNVIGELDFTLLVSQITELFTVKMINTYHHFLSPNKNM